MIYRQWAKIWRPLTQHGRIHISRSIFRRIAHRNAPTNTDRVNSRISSQKTYMAIDRKSRTKIETRSGENKGSQELLSPFPRVSISGVLLFYSRFASFPPAPPVALQALPITPPPPPSPPPPPHPPPSPPFSGLQLFSPHFRNWFPIACSPRLEAQMARTYFSDCSCGFPTSEKFLIVDSCSSMPSLMLVVVFSTSEKFLIVVS